MTQLHTPTPWHHATEISSICGLPIVAKDGRFICDMAVVPKAMPHADEINAEAKANAAYIVKAVNCHEELVEAATIAEQVITAATNMFGEEPMEGSALKRLRDAIAKAGAA